ncbi:MULTISPECIES: type I restriction-modification system subunit M [unclassified Crossiella]|uniref:type I restriction-modification system subunit M n=1 Tax=unclassified Crossiella TaxID=2620835 RepID=UPI001FFF78B6|nr:MULTISPECIES: type I restriction-modification system subunit M [unclassified Crossiella]MCK2237404.1 type I restriction-modification system subunit M [Crossiella sp. S99.2]MCK2251059.1 type I restriction-modification system subunit M [Crossiella sp. S99.1]
MTQQEIENRLWDAADELRVAMPEAQYSSVVFPLMFWKYLSDTWEHHHQEFLADNFLDDNEGLDALSDEEAHEIEYRDYQLFEIPFIHPGTVRERRASWSSILATITQPGLGQRVRSSLQAIETANPDKFSRLFGSMTWTSEEVLPGEVLAAVMQTMDRTPKMHEGNMSHDVLGGAYEYLLKRFSDGSGTRAGQFFTPREVVELIVEILDPKGFESVYDPTCGSGGMLIASANLLKARGGRGYTLKLHGQEAVPDTAGVARMNLFMHNLTQFQVEIGDTLKDPRFKKSDGSVEQFDVIVANPPYSLKWKPWAKDPRALGGVAPQSTADWAFVQHMIASMGPKKGRAGVVLPHGVLFRGGQEAAIRQRVLDDDLLEAVIGLPANLFYSTSIPTCILVLRAPGTKAEERRDGVLFIDASTRFAKAKNRNILTEADIAGVVTAYHAKFDTDGNPFDPDGDGGLAVRFVPTAEITANGYDLNIGRYIKQVAAEQEDLGTLIDAYNIARAERQKSEQRMLAVLAAAGIEGFDA